MERLDDLLIEIDCRALLVLADNGKDPYLLPFCNVEDLSAVLLVVPVGGAPRLGYYTPMERDEAARSGLDLLDPKSLDIARWAREGGGDDTFLAHVISRAFHLCELAPGKVALAGVSDVGRVQGACAQLAKEGWSFVPGERLVRHFRKTKSSAQVEIMRQAARGVERAYHHVAEILRTSEVFDGDELWWRGERLTNGRLRVEVDRLFLEARLEWPAGRIVAAGEESAVPHNHGSPERVLKQSESLIVDLYPRSTLFVDFTRTFCVGEPTPELRAAHAAVLGAVDIARRAARPGRLGWQVDEEVCAHFDRLGYSTFLSDREALNGYVHGLGHGVGFEVHEWPLFYRRSNGADGTLEIGDVFTLEPGLYDPEAPYGVRIEDTYLMSVDSVPEPLLDLPTDLDPHAWRSL